MLTTRCPGLRSPSASPASSHDADELVAERSSRARTPACSRGRGAGPRHRSRCASHARSRRCHWRARGRDLCDVHGLDAGEPDGPHAGSSSSIRLPSGSIAKQRWPPQGGENGSARNGTPAAPARGTQPGSPRPRARGSRRAREGSRGATIATPGRSSAGWPCSASESRAPALTSVAYGGSS